MSGLLIEPGNYPGSSGLQRGWSSTLALTVTAEKACVIDTGQLYSVAVCGGYPIVLTSPMCWGLPYK